MRLILTTAPHHVQNRLLKVQVETIPDNKAALVQCLYTDLLNCTSIILRAQDPLKLLTIALLGVKIELADNKVFKLARGPPGVTNTFQQRSCTKGYLFWHFVNARLT